MNILILAALRISNSNANEKALKVTSGNCKLMSTQEVITLKNVDPFMHFGMFAEGFSSRGDRIYLGQYSQNSIYVSMHGVSIDGYSIVTLAENGPTVVKMGVSMISNETQIGELLTCDLEVQ